VQTAPCLLMAMALVSAAPAGAQDRGAAELGHQLYRTHCERCHGKGMVTSGAGTIDLRTFPADQRARFEVSVTQGTGLMPGWGSVLDAEQIGALWSYVISRGEIASTPKGRKAPP
jgi:cytochrome c55X